MSVIKLAASPYWYTNFVFAGKQVRKSTGTTDRDKAQEYEDRLKASMWDQQRLGVKPRHLWEEAVIDYLEQMPESANKRNTRYAIKWLNKHLAGKALQDITRGVLADLQKKLLRAGNKPATIDRKIGIVVAILNKAVDWEWLDTAPAIDNLHDGSKRLRYLAGPEEAERLLMELRPHQRHLCIFALETGLRRHNVTHLRWEYVDLERRLATVPASQVKGNTRTIVVPLSELAMQLLEQVRGEHPEYVFTYRGRPQYQTATRAWRNALKRAGITDFRWHDLRHTWASWHIQGDTPERILQDLGGWKDRKMVAHYAHLAASHLAPYVDRHRKLPGSVLSLVSAKSGETLGVATGDGDAKVLIQKESGNSSVGRAQPCQGRRRPAGLPKSSTCKPTTEL